MHREQVTNGSLNNQRKHFEQHDSFNITDNIDMHYASLRIQHLLKINERWTCFPLLQLNASWRLNV